MCLKRKNVQNVDRKFEHFLIHAIYFHWRKVFNSKNTTNIAIALPRLLVGLPAANAY